MHAQRHPRPVGRNCRPRRYLPAIRLCCLRFGICFLDISLTFQDNQQISLGQTKFNVTSSNIEAIPSGKNNIPSATVVQNPTTLVLGSALLPSNIPIVLNPTGTSVGGAIPSASSRGSSSAASGYGFYGSKTGMWFGLTTCMCVIIGGFLAL